MRANSACFLLGALSLTARAAPAISPNNNTMTSTGQATLPQNDQNPLSRKAGVAARNEGYIYGPSLIGDAAPFPNGTLGNARSKADMDLWAIDREDIDGRIEADVKVVGAAIHANGGWKDMNDYARILYTNTWNNSNPRGPTPGILTNFTQDLLFSMERLSQNPYPMRLVKPDDKLPFDLDDDLATKIATASLADLQKAGNLFVVDHKYQQAYEKTALAPKRYGAACTAYFFLHPQSKDFLPLAIKTSTGKDLVYTPLDQPNDWMLAKLMFNVNDMFHSQMFHLVASHDISEAVHQAALHTLSENHPIMVVLDRLMLQGYSSRIVGEQLCFNPGGHWDQLMYVDNVGCRQFVTETWSTAGAFQANYLDTDLKTRGLLNADGKSPFKSFPFYDDASEIRAAYHAFFQSFVDSYYSDDAAIAKDYEVQAWFTEATAHAKVQDFPQISASNPLTKATLTEVLTHFGYIVSVVHHALNGGDPVGSKATLPFHASALFAPIPEAKGVTDLMPFLPAPAQAIHYVGFIASFNRPFYPTSERSAQYAFSNDAMLKRLNKETADAAETFMQAMAGLSKKISSRGFDENGLSEGMPFVYRTLDPGYIPFFCSV